MKHNIFGLDVPMNNPQRMNLINCIANLLHYERNPRFWQRLRLFQVMVQLPSRSYLQNNINVFLIVKVPVHLDNIRMVEVHLNFELSDELLCDLLFFQQLLFDYFQRADEA